MRFRRRKLGEISLDEMVTADDKSCAPRNQIGWEDLNLSGLIDRLGGDRAIEQLPAGCKRMFMLHDVEGYGHFEIAKILGCSVGNSKSQLHKAGMRLRQLLQEQVGQRSRGEHGAGIADSIGARVTG